MKPRLRSFNIYFFAAAAILASGCGSRSLSLHKDYTFLRVYMEARNGASSGSQIVEVAHTPIFVVAEPFLTEQDVSQARLMDNPDGTYDIQVSFNDHGSLVLDMTTTSSRGLDLVICVQYPPRSWNRPNDSDAFPSDKSASARSRYMSWSAVRIRSGLTGGTIVFTPDASRVEAQRIVDGLNNIVSELNRMNR